MPRNKGYRLTEEHKKKISEAHIGKKLSESTKQKLRDLYLGKTYEEIHGIEKAKLIKQKLEISLYSKNRGKARDRDIVLKSINSKLGHIVTEETRDKLRLARQGKTYEDIFGKDKAIELKKKFSKLLKGEGNPFYNKEHSAKTRKYLSEIRKGRFGLENHPNWKGGKSFEPYDYTFSRKFKNYIRNRDNQVCMLCKVHREQMSRSLDIHHINYDKSLSMKENCISLCRKCHVMTNYNREHWIKLFREILTEQYGYKYNNGYAIINIGVTDEDN